MTEYNVIHAKQAKENANTIYVIAQIVQGCIMAASIGMGLTFSIIIIRGIRQPVKEITEAAVQIANGNLDAHIAYQGRDEFGILSDNMRELVRKLNTIISDENEFLAKMASGDFTVESKCEHEYIGGFHPLLVSFQGIANRLNNTLSEISTSSAASGQQLQPSGQRFPGTCSGRNGTGQLC